jgi:glutamate racemase
MLGIFDSGIGGLTVAQQVRQQAPKVDIAYFGDVKNVPYGSRNLEELELLTLRAMKFLRAQGATHLVSACNSISTTVIRSLVDLLGAQDTSITEMVKPTVQALMPEHNKKISVVATPATVQSGMYANDFAEKNMPVNMLSIPSLAKLIESDAPVDAYRQVLTPAIREIINLQTDILVLGCTHYPLIESLFTELLIASSKPIRIFNPAASVASAALMKHGTHGQGRTLVFTSQLTDNFHNRVKQVFGNQSIEIVTNQPAKIYV